MPSAQLQALCYRLSRRVVGDLLPEEAKGFEIVWERDRREVGAILGGIEEQRSVGVKYGAPTQGRDEGATCHRVIFAMATALGLMKSSNRDTMDIVREALDLHGLSGHPMATEIQDRISWLLFLDGSESRNALPTELAPGAGGREPTYLLKVRGDEPKRVPQHKYERLPKLLRTFHLFGDLPASRIYVLGNPQALQGEKLRAMLFRLLLEPAGVSWRALWNETHDLKVPDKRQAGKRLTDDEIKQQDTVRNGLKRLNARLVALYRRPRDPARWLEVGDRERIRLADSLRVGYVTRLEEGRSCATPTE